MILSLFVEGAGEGFFIHSGDYLGDNLLCFINSLGKNPNLFNDRIGDFLI